jgi:hypothetical protein
MWPWPKKKEGIMEPDTRTDEEVFRDRYPKSAIGCKYMRREGSLMIFSANCLIDRKERDCIGKCSKFEPKEKVTA